MKQYCLCVWWFVIICQEVEWYEYRYVQGTGSRLEYDRFVCFETCWSPKRKKVKRGDWFICITVVDPWQMGCSFDIGSVCFSFFPLRSSECSSWKDPGHWGLGRRSGCSYALIRMYGVWVFLSTCSCRWRCCWRCCSRCRWRSPSTSTDGLISWLWPTGAKLMQVFVRSCSCVWVFVWAHTILFG